MFVASPLGVFLIGQEVDGAVDVLGEVAAGVRNAYSGVVSSNPTQTPVGCHLAGQPYATGGDHLGPVQVAFPVGFVAAPLFVSGNVGAVQLVMRLLSLWGEVFVMTSVVPTW
ncbi:hypothetical protein [Streptomyces sp. IBSBF 2806]|uniref:hypothetical protein n=1 Tax=Streptomyces sp. IBSBF 2806 TaxID=2903529 RepID=UPI002FDC6538